MKPIQLGEHFTVIQSEDFKPLFYWQCAIPTDVFKHVTRRAGYVAELVVGWQQGSVVEWGVYTGGLLPVLRY